MTSTEIDTLRAWLKSEYATARDEAHRADDNAAINRARGYRSAQADWEQHARDKRRDASAYARVLYRLNGNRP